MKALPTNGDRLRQKPFLPGDKWSLVIGLAGVIVCAWAYVVRTSFEMHGRTVGSPWMMEAHWDAQYVLLIFGMWVAMMVGMMLPSALPTILLCRRAIYRDPKVSAPATRTFMFAVGYVIAWMMFSVAATLLQWGLAQAALLSSMMVGVSSRLGAAILITAGAYQLTPLKHACIRHCRSPLAFLMQHWGPGIPNALSLGLRHGMYCVGCCWVLMLLLFVGGVMSLLWIAAITAFALAEKLAPYGVQGGRLGGIALILAGFWVLGSG